MERLDVVFKMAITFIGAGTTYLFGGWSTLLQILLAFVIIDYISGLLASSVEGKLSSKVGFKGIVKKVMIFVVVMVAHLVDSTMGENHLFRDAVVFFYIANELISILENAGRTGLPIPNAIKNAVDVLKGKGEGK